MGDAMTAGPARLAGHNSDEIEGYLARPAEDTQRGGVLVIHHMPGYDASSKEITRRFAVLGYNALCPSLHWRHGPGADPDDAAAAARAAGGVPDEQLVGDARAAIEHLRSLPTSNGKIGVIGYCSGGRQSVLVSATLPVDAAVDCYGAFVTGTPPEGFPIRVTPLYDQIPSIGAPLLGLFGKEDRFPSQEQVAELDELLTKNGKEHEFHSYDGAGHGFFSPDKPNYRVEAAVDGWEKITAFYGRHLA